MIVILRRIRLSSCLPSALIALVALTASALAAAAPPKKTMLFDFDDSPIAVFNPVFTQDGFTLSHTGSSPPKRGDAQWVTGGAPWPFSTGSMRLSSTSPAGGSGQVSATINFSHPISMINMRVATLAGTQATIRPILAAGAPAQPIPAATTINTGGGVSLYVLNGDGPYIGLALTASARDSFYWDDLSLTPPDATTIRGAPVRGGQRNAPLLNTSHFKKVALEVIAGGFTDADFCVAPDPRESLRGKGGKKESSDYKARWLNLRELVGTGTCTGALVEGELLTWQDLMPNLDIAPWFRAYRGEYTLPGDTTPTPGFWLIVAVVRTTAEFAGGVVSQDEAEAFGISYANEAPGEAPGCRQALAWRHLHVGGTVAAFGEFPNAEGTRMIMDTIQCNQAISMTRRSTHVYPLRLAATPNEERINVQSQFGGIEKTLTEVTACLPGDTNLGYMTTELGLARNDFTGGAYDSARAALEQIARIAQDTNFDRCPVAANYKGNLMARALAAAFTIWDRFMHASVHDWEVYKVPHDLDVPAGVKKTED